ncbi:MAG: aldo/keto reductase [Dehalococcoidales bacterium]|nr:aldo/keto reductase [Dehalococcoidales bacterium]
MSLLGFGTGCLFSRGEDRAQTDDAEAREMLCYAIERGINYLHLTFFPDERRRHRLSRLIGGVLSGYRDRVRISMSLPVNRLNTADDVTRYVETELALLGIPYVDYLVIAGLDRPELSEPGKTIKQAEALMARGAVGGLGLAFRGDYQTLKANIDGYGNWRLVQFSYSFMDADGRPGTVGVKYAAERGIAVIAVRPLAGGRLTRNIPESVARIWQEAPQHSPAQWALRWVMGQPEIASVVSDMSTLRELEENTALAESRDAERLSIAEEVFISRIRDAYRKLRPIPCTGCRGCMPCPQGIDVPRVFELYNEAVIYGDTEIAHTSYREENHRIGDCNECGQCNRRCGRNIPITDWLPKVRKLLEGEDHLPASP